MSGVEEAATDRAAVADPDRAWPSRFETTTGHAGLLEVMAVACSKGEEPSEDAFAADGPRIAVADGASSSWESGRWAQALVDAWIEAEGDRGAWLEEAKRGFNSATPDTTGSLEWLEEAAARRGAHAAFLGIEVTGEDAHLRWRACAVGDVTAVVVGRDGIVDVFPDPRRHGFGSHPALVSSLDPRHADVEEHEATITEDQILLLLSDAVAEFVLARADAAALTTLADAPSEAVIDLLSRAGGAGEIEIDDLTLLRLRQPVSGEDRTGSSSGPAASATESH